MKNQAYEYQIEILIKTIMIENEMNYNNHNYKPEFPFFKTDVDFNPINNMIPSTYAHTYLKNNDLFSSIFELIDYLKTPNKKGKGDFLDTIQKKVTKLSPK